MIPHYADATNTLYVGDCLDVLAGMDPESVDAVVTDPPYGLEFMGRDWDRPWRMGKVAGPGEADGTPFRRHAGTPSWSGSGNPSCLNCGGSKYDRSELRRCQCAAPRFPNHAAYQMRAFQQWCEPWAAECLRVLKPGGHLLAFGGTRTYHRLACAVEDVGFEVRDQMQWLYGSGFPKSLDVSKAIDAAAGADREVVGSLRTNVGVQGNNYARRAESGDVPVTAPATPEAQQWDGWGTALKPAHEPIVLARKPLAGTVAGNVTTHGTGALNVDGCRVGTGGQLAWSQPRDMGYHGGTDKGGEATEATHGRWPANVVLGCACEHPHESGCATAMLDQQSGYQRTGRVASHSTAGMWGSGEDVDYADTDPGGGASRFMYCAKASRAERDAANSHPTVKPVELMRWLVRLVTPPDGLVLDPFAGSGTTGIAATVENKRCVMVERDPDYVDIAVRRLSKPLEPTLDLGP